jgi:hypothetical protein
MKTSETLSKISAALLAAQKQIKFAAKDAKNPAFRSTYADLPSVIDAIKPALNEAGIVFVQTMSPSESGFLAITTRLMHESGEWIEDTATIPLQKNDPQGYGSAVTYGRRYGLAAITGLYQDDDDGNAASAKPNQIQATHSTATTGAWDGLTTDQQTRLIDIIADVKAHIAQGDDWGAYESLETADLDDAEKTALWSKLDSKSRSAIKERAKLAREKEKA